MGMKLWSGTALLLWLAAPAAQGLKAGELPIELHRGIEALRETLADPAASDEKIHARAQASPGDGQEPHGGRAPAP